MRLIRSTSVALASTALLSAPISNAHAVERNLLTWTGRVDKEVIIEIRGRDIATRGSGLDASWSPRIVVNQPLPRVPGLVRAYREDGRGDVDVLENPSPRNNYTAVVRVRDSRSGADNYRVVLTYESDDPRDFPGRGRGNGRDDDDWDRGPGRGRGGYDGGYDRGSDRDGVEFDRGRRDAGALRWGGSVDGVAEIRIQGSKVEMVAERGNRLRDVRYDVLGSSLPRRDVRLEVVRANGRGKVRIVQQPSVWNGYVAVIRIDDSRSGYGDYNFAVRW
ncbi:MAG: hypothetical protein ACO1Q7_05225 [Gemmatimonas sp.]